MNMRKILINTIIAATAVCMAPTTFAEEAGGSNNAAVEMAFWNSVKDSREPVELQAYLNKYPKGQFAELALIRKQNLEKTKPSFVATKNNLRNDSPQIANAEAKPVSTEIDPKFDQYLAKVKAALGEKRRPDIRDVLPVLLPAKNAIGERKVTDMANQLFRAQFPSAGTISIGSSGAIVTGVSQFSVNVQPENLALSDCENKRKGAEAVLPKCEVFIRSRTLDSKALLTMLEKARGPDFDAWVKGINESLTNSSIQPPTISK
jgi:hypothetical protein